MAQKLQGKWFKLVQRGNCPGPRSSHAIAVVGDKLYSFGGEFNPNIPIDKNLYVYDFKTHTWSIEHGKGDIPALPSLGVCMVAIGTKLYVFGGRDATRKYNGFYSYDTLTKEWKLLTPVEEGPLPRSFHSMTADDQNVYVFGGVSKTVRLNTIDTYNIVDGKWVKHSSAGDSCIARGAPGLFVVQGKIWVMFGFCGTELDDIFCFDPAQDQWSKVETTGEKPAGRSVFASTLVGKHIVIYGGELVPSPLMHLGAGKFSGETFALDTETLEWKKLDDWVEGTEEERPSPRGWCASTAATINGQKGMLMYGGNTPSNNRTEDMFFFALSA